MTSVDAILAIAGLLRDFAAVIVVVTGILAFISEVVGLLSKKQPRLDRRILEKGLIGFVFGILGCFAPLDRGLLFGLVESIICLVAGALLWGTVFVLRRLARDRSKRMRNG
jgi:hypothetical protein